MHQKLHQYNRIICTDLIISIAVCIFLRRTVQ